MGMGKGRVIYYNRAKHIDDMTASDFFASDYVFQPPDGRVLNVADMPEKLREHLLAMDALTNKRKKEVLGVFDHEGNMLLSDYLIGKRGEVEWTVELENLVDTSPEGSLVFVHSHPNSISFSADDIEITLECKSIGTDMVIGRGNVLYTYETRGRRLTGETMNDFERSPSPEGMAFRAIEERIVNTWSDGRMNVEDKHREGVYNDRWGQTFVDEGIQVRIDRNGKLHKMGMLNSSQLELGNARNELYLASQGLTMRTERLTDTG